MPPQVFAVDGSSVRLARFQQDADGRFELVSFTRLQLPSDSFHTGPLGGPLKDPPAFQATLAAWLAEQGESMADASLVLPDRWLRVAFSDIESLPRAEGARTEALRWKLKQLVPFRVDDLRVKAVELTGASSSGSSAEASPIMIGFGAEVLLSELEAAFAKAGVHLGLILNESLASAALFAEPGLIAQIVVRELDYSVLLLRDGEPVLVRQKILDGSLDANVLGSMVERELRLTQGFVQEQLDGEQLRAALILPDRPGSGWLDWVSRGLDIGASEVESTDLPWRLSVEPEEPWQKLAPMLGTALQVIA